jgi:DNA polymerase-3 subunit alpha
MISAADVTGVFQVESSGFRDLLKKLKPDCFEDGGGTTSGRCRCG